MSIVSDQVLKALIYIVGGGGGGAVVAWWIFSKFGETWLAEKFAKRLEIFKHEQAKDIEQVRHKITSLFSRISKIHEKEFEVLPTAWLKLHEAYGHIAGVCSALKQFPELSRMDDSLFEAFVESCGLHEVNKNKLRKISISERNEYYRNCLQWTELSEAKSAQENLNNYLVMNQIFMTEDLWKQFTQINKLLKSVLIVEEIVAQNPHIPAVEIRKQREEDFRQIQPLFPPLGEAIQRRLHYEEA